MTLSASLDKLFLSEMDSALNGNRLLLGSKFSSEELTSIEKGGGGINERAAFLKSVAIRLNSFGTKFI